MKKLLFSILASALVLSSVIFNTAASMWCSYEELSFQLPDYYIELAGGDSQAIEWKTDDDSGLFRLTYVVNDSALDFDPMEYTDAQEFYLAFTDLDLSAFEAYDVTDHSLENNIWGKNVYSIFEDDEMYPYLDVYLFSTEDYVYVLEFMQIGETEYDFIWDVVQSFSIEPYSYSVNNDYNYYDSDDDGLEFLGLIPVVLSVVVGIVIKSFSKNNTKGSTRPAQPKTQPQAVKVTVPKEKSFSEKFELNGKSVNSFNEKFVVGRKETNFAMKELERERKEREKMFD